MSKEIETFREVGAAGSDKLRDRLGWLESRRVDWNASRTAGRALTRVEQHRVAVEERVTVFAIDIARDKMIGAIAANAVTATGVIEARLNANASAADEALDQVVIAGCVGSVACRNSTLKELAGLLSEGAIGERELEHFTQLAARQHERRLQDTLRRGDASHARMATIVAGGLLGPNQN